VRPRSHDREKLLDIAELLFERGVIVSAETVRRWCNGMNGPHSTGEKMQDVDHRSREDGIEVPKLGDHRDLPRQIGVPIIKHTIVGVDIAKKVMQVHRVDPDSGEIVNKPIKSAAFLKYFANRPAWSRAGAPNIGPDG
jgi:hypothetical protein